MGENFEGCRLRLKVEYLKGVFLGILRRSMNRLMVGIFLF